MDNNLELQIAGLRRHILKMEEQTRHNAIYFDNKIKAMETAYKNELNILVFSTNNHSIRLRKIENERKGGGCWFW